MAALKETCHFEIHRIRLTAGGRIVIPAEVRHELGIKEGDELLLTRSDNGYRITTHRDGIRRAKEVFAQMKRPGESIVDELIKERRKESQKEEGELSKSYRRK